MLRALIFGSVFLVFATDGMIAGPSSNDPKRIIGEWLDSRSGKTSLFHPNGTWGVKRADDIPEQIHGRWWMKRGKLFFTYRDDNGAGTPIHIRTARCAIGFVSDDRFITESEGGKTVYDRYR